MRENLKKLKLVISVYCDNLYREIDIFVYKLNFCIDEMDF